MDIELFTDRDGHICTKSELREKLRRVGAADCDTLFVQTELSFGTPCRGLKRKELLALLADELTGLGVRTLMLATFSYSFANGEDYVARESRTDMGALLEYMRKLPAVCYRTSDPLLSVSLIGEADDAYRNLSSRSLGEGSAFDVLHRLGGAKFLMLGGEMGESLTYVHHVEAMEDVPYRYYQPFTGNVTDWDGNTYQTTQTIHTACGGIQPRCFHELEELMLGEGTLRRERYGDSKLVCLEEAAAYELVVRKLHENIHYFLVRPFAAADLTHEYQYGRDGERVTHC